VQHTTPAVVAQAAVVRLPRSVLLGLCAVYALSGFIGRGAWKSADMASVGFMTELAAGRADWWHPTLLGIASEHGATLPYWLGAWMLLLAPNADFALWLIRLPFIFLLAMTMAATWYGTYYLARGPEAQPVAFAFGGQAQPSDYARTLADGALLALIACLGLAQLGHETTPALAQLGFLALYFYGVCASPYHWRIAGVATLLGLAGLTLSGAPALALVYALGCIGIVAFGGTPALAGAAGKRAKHLTVGVLLLGCLITVLLATALRLWQWKISAPQALWIDWNGYGQLLVWFYWPAWPLALWAIWRWRRYIGSRHISIPLWLLGVTSLATLFMGSSDRTLLLGLPAIASLAAFSLPTLQRQFSSLIDWFALLFFSVCGLVVWVVWVAMQTGLPSQPAANVERLAPGFKADFSVMPLVLAVLATVCWAALVHWRTGRQRNALWKSVALPAGGAAWCWTLLMTLWLPLLDYTQGYSALTQTVARQIDRPGCVEVQEMGADHIAALQGALGHQLFSSGSLVRCHWLVSEATNMGQVPPTIDTFVWSAKALIAHPADPANAIWVMQRR